MPTTKSLSAITWILWYSFTAAFLFIWPSFKFGTAFWNQPSAQLIPHVILTASHLLVGLLLTPKVLFNKKITFQEIVLISLSLFGIIVLGLFLKQSPFSRMVLPLSVVFSLFFHVSGLLLLTLGYKRIQQTVIVLAIAVSLLSYILVITNIGGILEKTSGLARQSASQIRSGANTGPEKIILDTAFYKLDASYFTNYVEAPILPGGGLTNLGEQLLLTTGEGDFYLLDLDSEPGELKTKKLNLKVPSNYFDFVNEAPPSAQKLHFWFRVADVYAKTEGDEVHIFSTYHYWKSKTGTFVVRLARLKGKKEELFSDSPNLEWEILFESSPDLEIKPNLKSGLDFAGLQIGGRIQELDKDTLIFTVGDHEHDGWNFNENYPQDPNASYGKMIKLDLNTGTSTIFSTGHRNPQGLYVDPEGRIWSTEHGPQGGGELNLIKEGLNYGWPWVTFGTEYGMREWPLSKTQADHPGYEYPIYAFAKSQGLSGIIGLEKSLFPSWKGDLILSSLVGSSLFRVKMRQERAITIETIGIGKRIRDLIEDATGRIVLWTDKGQIVVIQPSDQKDIVIPPVFIACSACHSVNPGEAHRIGPNLSGILNRDIASAEGFAYSPGIKQITGQWSEENLDKLLQDPQAMAPGTTMVYPPVTDSDQRKQILDFLKSL